MCGRHTCCLDQPHQSPLGPQAKDNNLNQLRTGITLQGLSTAPGAGPHEVPRVTHTPKAGTELCTGSPSGAGPEAPAAPSVLSSHPGGGESSWGRTHGPLPQPPPTALQSCAGKSHHSLGTRRPGPPRWFSLSGVQLSVNTLGSEPPEQEHQAPPAPDPWAQSTRPQLPELQGEAVRGLVLGSGPVTVTAGPGPRVALLTGGGLSHRLQEDREGAKEHQDQRWGSRAAPRRGEPAPVHTSPGTV